MRRLNNRLDQQVKETTYQIHHALNQIEHLRKWDNDNGNSVICDMALQLKAPIYAVLSVCDMALASCSDERQKEYLSIIREAIEPAHEKIRDILELRELESGKVRVDNHYFSLEKLVFEIVSGYRDELSGKDIEMIVDISPDIPEKVESDEEKIRRILTALVDNSVKFTASGEIYLCIAVKYRYADHLVLTLTVADTGAGIPPSDVKNVTLPFYRLKAGEKDREGIGIGLSLCRGFVAALGGELTIESKKEEGLAVTVELAFGSDPDMDLNDTVVYPDFVDKEVFLVEDNFRTRDVLSRYLQSFGLSVETAESGEEAVSRLKETAPDSFLVLFIDYDLPDSNGIELVKRLEKEVEAKSFAKVLLTGKGGDILAEQANEAGIGFVLHKPVKKSDLYDIVLQSVTGEPDLGIDMGLGEENIRVLLADDNWITRKAVSEILENAGITVESLGEPASVLSALASRSFDVLILNVKFAHASGFELAEKIRDNPENAGLPILAITAKPEQDREKCLRSGINEIIPKPVDATNLFEILNKQLGRASPPGIAVEGDIARETMQGSDYRDSLPGLDIKEGVTRLAGSFDLFIDLTSFFCEDKKYFCQNFKKLIEKQDYDSAELKAHALKGSAAMISAGRVARAAWKLETACREKKETDIQKALESVEQALDEVRNSAQMLINNGDTT
jgi:CheY-like chemotaxis protein/two-component sensor histidine kinase